MAEKVLEPEHKLFIVQQLAMFERPKYVQAKLKEVFGVEISLQGVHHYQITSKELSKELKKIFNSTRKKFLADSSQIAIANKSFRLQKLQNIFDAMEDAKLQNTVEMRATLEQAAKESGDAFSNRQQIELKNVTEMSDEELLAVTNSKSRS